MLIAQGLRGNMSLVNLYENYLTNADEIIQLAEQERDSFSYRAQGQKYNFSNKYGDSKIKSLFYFNMSQPLKDAIFKTLPDEDKHPSSFVINRYDPGDFLQRHNDASGGYWKFKLIFLRSDRPHFKWYDQDNVGHIVDEKPGMFLEFSKINIEHEVTLIELDERPKFSLVLAWGGM